MKWVEILLRMLRGLLAAQTATLIIGVLSIVVLVIRIAMEPSATRATKRGRRAFRC